MKKFMQGLMAGVVMFACAGAAQAEWPERPVTIVVSQAAGASPDIMARLIADGLSKTVGGQFIVDNRPGGGNVVGSASVAKAAPDGYTLFFATSAALVTNPFVMKNLPFDVLKDFDAISLVAMSQILIAADPKSGIATMEDLIAKAKQAPASVSIGVDSPRNLSGIIARTINHDAGVDLTLVSYNNITQAVQDTIAGVIPVTVQSESVAMPYIKEGSLKPIAVASATRSMALPDVPTVAETLPGFDLKGWFMVVGPHGIDPAISAKLNTAIRQVLQRDEITKLADKLGFEMIGTMDVTASKQFLAYQMNIWRQLSSNLGIKPE